MLRSSAGLIITGLFAISCQAQDRTNLARVLDFEVPQPSSCPAGWSCSPRETITVDTETVHSGEDAVRLERDQDSKQAFSTVTKAIPADFAGRTLVLRGYIRSEKVSDFCGFWLREDSAGGSTGFVSMQQNGPVKGTTEWKQYSISLPLNPKSNMIVFGFLMSGAGKAWADDLELLIDGKPVADAPLVHLTKTALDSDHEFDKGSKITLDKLSEPQIINLVMLGKVWGFLKYHHPLITSGASHFDYELLRVLPAVLAAEDRKAASEAISVWIDKLGKIPPCQSCAQLNQSNLHLQPDLAWLSDEATLGADLSRALIKILNSRPAKPQQFYVSLNPGVSNPSFENEPNYANVRLPDAGFQILGLFRYWNIIQYWYPYRDVVGEDWSGLLPEFLPKVALAKDRDSYQLAMMLLIARVHDTHANLWSSLQVRPPVGACQLPVNIRFIEDEAVVANYSHPEVGKATGLQPGDVIRRIDGVPVNDLLRSLRPYYAASNEPTRLRDIARYMTRGDCAKPVELQILRGDETRTLQAKRAPSADVSQSMWHDQPGDTFRLISKDVAYLKLSSIKAADVPGYIDSAAQTKGLIIDIRNYPSDFMPFTLGQLLIDQPVEFVRFTRANLLNPGAFYWDAPLKLEPRKPHYAGKVVILVDEVSQSQAEYTTMALRTATGAIVMGSTTAGADGNVSQIPLPGGLNTMISGIGVFYPDKKPTQRIGILPDVEVKPTIKGIREGKDELLDAAVRQIMTQK